MIKPLLISLQFLTVIPVKVRNPQEKDFGRSLGYFPLTGCLIGALLGGLAAALHFLPSMVAAAILTATSVWLTGGIHLDGFADTCDGLYGKKNKDRSLEIMRDSRIGVMGAAGVFLLLLVKFSVFVSFPFHDLWKILIVSAAFPGGRSPLPALFLSMQEKKERLSTLCVMRERRILFSVSSLSSFYPSFSGGSTVFGSSSFRFYRYSFL